MPDDHWERCERFARARGWRVLRRGWFSLAELAAGRRLGSGLRYNWDSGIDHNAWFVWPSNGKPAGIFTQPYAKPSLIGRLNAAFAKHYVPLVAAVPPEGSWWCAPHTVGVLMTRKPRLGCGARPNTEEVIALAHRIACAMAEALDRPLIKPGVLLEPHDDPAPDARAPRRAGPAPRAEGMIRCRHDR